jgi:uncharacterized protein (TIGR02996 family)
VTDGQALLQAILDYPNDDVPRLVYADWLEEHDDPARAEFIRAQVELASLPEGHPELDGLRKREQELWRAHGPRWRQVVAPWLRGGVVFRRGFIDEFDGTIRAFFQEDESTFWRVAPARVLRLTWGHWADAEKLFASASRARVAALELREFRLDLPQVEMLLRGPRLLSLELTRCFVSVPADRAARHLVGSPRASLLRYHNHIDDVVAIVLADLPGLADLTRLGLAHNAIGDAGAGALAESPHLRNLASLDLRGNVLGEQGAHALRRRFGPRVSLGEARSWQ